MWALKVLVVLVALYAAVALFAYAAQTYLLFPTSLASGSVALPSGAERIARDTPDGERLRGVRIPPAADSSEGDTIVLGFGGNAWNAESMAIYLHQLFPEAEIVTFHYRGYRPSTGKPSAAMLLSDALLVHDLARETGGKARIVAVGFSIGSGIAAHLASERPIDGLILVTPFDTLEQLARQHYGWLPVSLLLRHHMSPVDELRKVTAPVAIIAAERDTIIPGRRTAPVREAARNLVMDHTIPGVGHNDIYANPDFVAAMQQAMRLMEQRTSSDPPPDAAATQA